MAIHPGGPKRALNTVGRMLAPSEPGVYAICDASGNYIYFGETYDIQRRINEHMQDPSDCIHAYGPSSYAYEVHRAKKVRVARQNWLIAAHPTPCNRARG